MQEFNLGQLLTILSLPILDLLYQYLSTMNMPIVVTDHCLGLTTCVYVTGVHVTELPDSSDCLAGTWPTGLCFFFLTTLGMFYCQILSTLSKPP